MPANHERVTRPMTARGEMLWLGLQFTVFGRIGRSLLRVALKDELFVPVSISEIKDVPTLAALFEVDSNYGRWPDKFTTKDCCFVIGGPRSLTTTP